MESGLLTSYKAIPSPLSSAIYASRPAATALQKVIVDGISVERATAEAQADMEEIARSYRN